MKYAVSSCLLGINCKYSGGNNRCEALIQFLKDKDYIAVCPEVLGGLPTPRPCVELKEGRAINDRSEDVTKEFKLGAGMAVSLIQEHQVDLVITQPRSPSCGAGRIYDGSFQGRLIQGNGIFVEQLIQQGIPVMTLDAFLSEDSAISQGKSNF